MRMCWRQIIWLWFWILRRILKNRPVYFCFFSKAASIKIYIKVRVGSEFRGAEIELKRTFMRWRRQWIVVMVMDLRRTSNLYMGVLVLKTRRCAKILWPRGQWRRQQKKKNTPWTWAWPWPWPFPLPTPPPRLRSQRPLTPTPTYQSLTTLVLATITLPWTTSAKTTM